MAQRALCSQPQDILERGDSIDSRWPLLFSNPLPWQLFRSPLSPLLAVFATPRNLQRPYQSSVPAIWQAIKTPTLKCGRAPAAVYFLISILLYHVQRVLVPWLGAFPSSPLDDLRLTLSNPDIFLEETSSYSWKNWLFNGTQKHIFDLVGSISVILVVREHQRSGPSVARTRSQPDGNRRRLVISPAIWECVLDTAIIFSLMWMFSCVEYAICRTSNTASFIIAIVKLVNGKESDQLALKRILDKHWTRLLITVCQAAQYVTQALLPMTQRAAVSAVRGKPALLSLLLLSCASVAALLRYRSKVFIALEMSNMFVVLGLAVGSICTLAWDSYG